MSDLLPAPIAAVAMARACRQLSTELPSSAARILANSWMSIHPILAESIKSGRASIKAASAAVFLESYFAHRGDWRAMEREISESLQEVPDLEGLISELSEVLLLLARKEASHG